MALRGISKEDIHNITSGQVITDLNNIVKELVENAVDAHSSSITVTFKRFGLDGLEVSDNGDGIKEEDFQNLCLKNYTSKLESFERLVDVKTLGFRGEALNSICNICQVSILTAEGKAAPKGSELIYDKSGDLINQKVVNQSKGTSVRVSDIFKALPVRRLYLEKHYRKEFQKCLQTLMSYLLILTNFRFIVYNVDVTGRKKIMMKTTGNSLIKDNIINVYGATGLQGLAEVNKDIELDDAHRIKLSGMLSNSSIGSGRLSRDRQYLYINKRPVVFKSITKLINDIYKRFNYLQYPMIILDLNIHEHLIDINVTPDKKTILMAHKYEILLMSKLETFLEEFWDSEGNYNIPINDLYQEKLRERNASLGQSKLESFALFQEAEVRDSDDDIQVEVFEKNASRDSKVTVDINYVTAKNAPIQKGSADNLQESKNTSYEAVGLPDPAENIAYSEPAQSSMSDLSLKNDELYLEESMIKSQLVSSIEVELHSREASPLRYCDSCPSKPTSDIEEKDHANVNLGNNMQLSPQVDPGDDLIPRNEDTKEAQMFNQKVKINEKYLVINSLKRRRICSKSKTYKNLLEKSDICDHTLSEKLLCLSVHKNDFSNMEVVGQFNKGFIIVYKKDTDDIFIIDQHASDEKFNFEKLIGETTFENQPLVVPQKLDLNTIERLTIMNHLKTFEKNGFKFKTVASSFDSNDSHEEPQENNLKREDVYLTSLPYSKNTIFDLKDLNELIQLVQDRGSSTKSIPRPSKVRSMFAMRACRSSIMIGSSLSKLKMENVVQNLSKLDKPWNCPHGRPTMRHLVKIDQWNSFNDDYRLC